MDSAELPSLLPTKRIERENADADMADVFSKKKRSDIMSRVKGRGNVATELRLIRIFRENKITGWRRHLPLVGNPDFVFPKLRIAVFVDGCFWHGCPHHGSIPATNRRFWVRKLERNKTRDKVVARALKKKEWQVFRIWQHELRQENKVAKRILRKIRGR